MKTFQKYDPLLGPISGRVLIEASAGTGKTFTISRIFLRLILERNLAVDQILVVTFTEAATNELKERIQNTLLEAKQALQNPAKSDELSEYLSKFGQNEARSQLEKALHNFDEAAILTIHRFCNRILHENTFESGGLFDAELVTEQTGLLRQVVQDFWRKKFYNESGIFLKYALEQTNPESLFKLLGARLGRHQLNILPKPETLDTSRQETHFQSVYEKAKADWLVGNNELQNVLRSHSGLYKKVADKLSILFELANLYFLPEHANPQIFKDFEFLTQKGIKVKKGFELPEHPFLDSAQALLDSFNELKTCYDKKITNLKAELFDYVRTELERRKLEQNILYFDDLLLNVHAAISDGDGSLPRQVRKKYRAALIDEFQDTDPVQYEIFNAIFGTQDRTLMLIGDPKQAIYGFRGADIFAYMKAKSETPETERYTLTKNHRSNPELVTAFNGLFQKIENAFLYEQIPFHKAESAEKQDAYLKLENSDEALSVWFYDPAGHSENGKKANRESIKDLIVDAVVSQIESLLNDAKSGKATIKEKDESRERQLEEKDIAVLVRSNAEARAIQSALNQRGIHGVLYGSDSLFSASEVLELETILEAVAEPSHIGRLKAALATELLGVGSKTLLQFTENDSGLETWFLKFKHYAVKN